MNEYLITVVVAVYNGTKYIERCLASLIEQTIFESLQIVLVDDGSTDSSLEILKNYEKKYENINVIHIQNQGVSQARNIGMSVAKGEYITFVDIDDWVDSACYEEMYLQARSKNADIVAAGMYISNGNKDIVERKISIGNQIVTGEMGVYDYLIESVDVHCWNKLFKANTIKEIKFDTNLKIAEDRLFVYWCFVSAKVVVLMGESFYHYYQNPASVMNQKFSEKNMDSLRAAEKILVLTQTKYPQLKEYAKAMYISTACRMYCEMCRNNQYRKLQLCRDLRSQIKMYKIVDATKYMSKKHTIALMFAKISPRLFGMFRRNSYLKFVK